mgnify:CR=1 FL=1
MSIKLTGATSGSIELDVPAAVSGGDISLTLPNGVGTADQVLKNGSTPGTLEFAQPKAQPGQVIETISSICNGSSVTVGSGTYSIPSVTTPQYPGVTFEDVTGSSLAYTPPSGANTVVYEFHVCVGYAASSPPLGHFKFFLDSTEVTCVRSSVYMYYDGIHVLRIPLSLNNATEDIANGKVGTWTSSKTMKLQARSYSTVYTLGLHRAYHWDGTGNPQNVKPTLSITSIA